MILSQEEYNVAKQRNRSIYAKIILLNFNFQKIDEWDNVVVGDPTFTNNSESDIRRTCSISLVPLDKSFEISEGNKIWLDKYIQIHLGIKEQRSGEIIYTNMGIYMINNPSKVYSAVDNTITIEGLDLVARMTGLRNGNLEGMIHIIKQGENVRQSIIEVLKSAGFNKYVVEECPYEVPNDINISIGGTVWGILSELKAIVEQYQMYFDVDGIFHYEKIPSGDNEQIMVDDDLWKSVYLNHSESTDFTTLKNVVEVIGKTHDIKHFAEATLTDSIYNATIATITTLRNNIKIGFTTPSSIYQGQAYLKINSLDAYPIKNENETIPNLNPDTYYVVKFIEDKNYFKFMGEITPYAIAKENNPNSPFYVGGTIGEIRIVLQGGEYDNIFTSDLAQERANWELYTHCRLKNSVTITCVPVYWLDVNWVVELTLPNKNGIETKNKYIIKQINTSHGVNGTQQITLMRYYPFYSF